MELQLIAAKDLALIRGGERKEQLRNECNARVSDVINV